jgi:hypothetical protein
MIDVAILQISVSILTVAVKGHQEGIIQQQITAMGLRQWLSLVVAWIVNWIYVKASSILSWRVRYRRGDASSAIETG